MPQALTKHSRLLAVGLQWTGGRKPVGDSLTTPREELVSRIRCWVWLSRMQRSAMFDWVTALHEEASCFFGFLWRNHHELVIFAILHWVRVESEVFSLRLCPSSGSVVDLFSTVKGSQCLHYKYGSTNCLDIALMNDLFLLINDLFTGPMYSNLFQQ